jgi:hypothetical protein
VTGPPSTTIGSQVVGTQTIGACASGYQTSMVRSMAKTEGNEGSAQWEVTSGKRKLRWLSGDLEGR